MKGLLSEGAEDARDPIAPSMGIEVRHSPGKGRGVFAMRPFRRGDLVERAPVLVVPEDEHPHIVATVLNSYVFGWGDGGVAVCLGFGSIYNHSWDPSVEYQKHLEGSYIDFVALRDVAPGEELFVNYASSYPDTAHLWADLE
jgi:hypothetical protein